VNQGGGRQVRTHHPDYGIALVITVLLAVGLVLMYSISPILSHKLVGTADRNVYFLNQIKYVAAGVLAWIIATAVPYHKWRAWAPWLLGIAVAGLVLLLVPGLAQSSNGATRWLNLRLFSVQPAEILKLALILYLAKWFEAHQEELGSLYDGVVPFSIMVGIASFVIVILQRDMGTAMVLLLTALGMYFVAGLRWRHVAALVASGVALGWAAVAMFPHRLSRLTTFLDPSKDVTGQGYHINQALIAIGSGGILGLGLGHSIQVYGYLPEAANDSIYAIIAEEFGLVGGVAVAALFGLLAYRGLSVAKNAPDTFGRLVAAGVSLWLAFQAAINIGAMLSLVPLTGIPLPFISYGGTSLVISLLGAGVLLNISKYTVREAGDANSRLGRRDSRSYLAGPGNLRRVRVPAR
jgi:cell division protein FtsW